MAMTRREFGKYLALLAAGASALPAQLQAFERLYEVNLPQAATGLIQVNDFWVGFRSPKDLAVRFLLTLGKRREIPFVLNYRASLRYVSPMDAPLLTTLEDLAWDLDATEREPGDRTDIARAEFEGALRVTDQDGRIHDLGIDGKRRRLQDYFR